MAANDFRRYLGRTVLVQLDDNEMVGELVRATATTITLKDAALTAGDEPVPVDGHVLIDRLRVAWVQIP